MKIQNWIKSEYVIIGIALLPLQSGGLAPPKHGGQAAFYVL